MFLFYMLYQIKTTYLPISEHRVTTKKGDIFKLSKDYYRKTGVSSSILLSNEL